MDPPVNGYTDVWKICGVCVWKICGPFEDHVPRQPCFRHLFVNSPHVNRPKTIRNESKSIGKYPNSGWSLSGFAAQGVQSNFTPQWLPNIISTDARVIETGTQTI